MASGSHHCKDCGLYFESARSLEVHLQYHKENLMNMWMGSDERGREGGAPAPSPGQGGELTPLGVGSGDGGLVSSSVQSVNTGVSSSAFTAPSPMQYEYKMSPGLQSPQGGVVVPQGPPSGHGISVGFPQQSPGGFYPDYGQQQHHQQQPQQFPGYQLGFLNGGFDDGFYGRGPATAPRFHPYMGRSPAPTPSPGNPPPDIKEEMSTTDTPEILDLDSQKVLGSSAVSQPPQPQSGPLPPMWRPHEQFPAPSGMPMGSLPPMQQPGFPPGPPPPPQHIPPLGGSSSFLSGGGGGIGGYHPQGLATAPQAMTSPSSVFGAPPPSPRETAPPSEFASNVKRPKSFKCEDCNKWFTSHGHLKRHYNTTLHKNMTKLNGNNASRSTPDPTRPPILSPGAKSIGEASNISSQDEESNLSATDALETPPPPTMQQPPPAYNPPPTSISGYQPPGVPGPSQGLHPPPQFSQAPHFLGGEQPPTAPTLYHGHFSTNPAGFGGQPPVSMGGGPPFYPGSGNNNFGGYQTQGGHQGPGFHSMSEYPGQSLDGFNNFKLDSESGSGGGSRSPEPAGGDTGSEASMDSSESGGTTSSVTTGEGTFRCQDCGKLFNRMCYLTQHRTTYHEGEKPFKCGTCGKRFPDELAFSDHQNKHAGDKPYKCEVCPKQFNHKTDLRRHMCLHTGEKPFTCEQCGKGFIRKDHMLKHFQTHRKKAMAATAAPSHPPQGPAISHAPPGFPGHHPGHRPGVPHGAMGHPGHGPPGHPGHPPHVVAPPVY
ncbi:trithorax group protein osa-like [Eriocheir sinensis]|uniref:trithorax group protein osa-like n=1 Tax=Eriocheir sinensis TaxID=95602 RepID=UPI0021C737C4|nr:trithorax group protein osa-like [Eriocheir sinensis]XP_050717312.1 trithorax group protein osa-like [Eriocheir sinensis]